jgi:hypothetical protein
MSIVDPQQSTIIPQIFSSCCKTFILGEVLSMDIYILHIIYQFIIVNNNGFTMLMRPNEQ